MKLYAISDLHLMRQANRAALLNLAPHPRDWLIVAGDVSESIEQFTAAMTLLAERFARVIWTPGNHDLWTLPNDPTGLRGLARYNRLVAICRELGVSTPDDPYPVWDGPGAPAVVAPIFTLYDYSFRPDEVAEETAVAWAQESGVLCVDELALHPDPFPSRAVWCTVRCRYTEKRLEEVAAHGPLILANHYPLRRDMAHLRRIPRFSIWCGTRRTEDWHTRFPVTAVVYGHLHIRRSHQRDGVQFDEVSLGYPGQWQPARGIEPYLRQILPRPSAPA